MMPVAKPKRFAAITVVDNIERRRVYGSEPPKDKIVQRWNDQPYDEKLAVTFMGLTPTNCHWPVRDDERGKPRLFCGAPAPSENCPYCELHRIKSTSQMPGWPRK